MGGHRADQTCTIAATALCFVKGFIDQANGAFQRNLRLRSGHRKARISDGNRALNGLPVPQYWVTAHRLQESLDGLIRLFRRDWIEDGEEFLPAPTYEFIALAQSGSQTMAHRCQHRVSRRVSQRVVDSLEMIEIRQQHTASDRMCTLDAQHVFVEIASIAQAGQCVTLAVEAKPIVGLPHAGKCPKERGTNARHEKRPGKDELLPQ